MILVPGCMNEEDNCVAFEYFILFSIILGHETIVLVVFLA